MESARRFVSRIRSAALSRINTALGKLEPWFMPDGSLPPGHPPIFIIGAPRTGTTLLYQLLVSRYQLAYFSNVTALFYRAPIIATWAASLILPERHVSDFRSVHGRTQNWWGPNECGRFWYRWFPKGDHVYVPPGATSSVRLDELRREVVGTTKVANKPVVFKNTYNSMRIAPILEALPEACFLVCQRDPVDVAQSLLRGRAKVYGDKGHWWSLPPREVDEIKNHPHWEQVVEQVYYISRQIQDDRRRFGDERFHDVSYEQLCRDTYAALGRVEVFLDSKGVLLATRGDVPRRFSVSTGKKVNDVDYAHIVQEVKARWGKSDAR